MDLDPSSGILVRNLQQLRITKIIATCIIRLVTLTVITAIIFIGGDHRASVTFHGYDSS